MNNGLVAATVHCDNITDDVETSNNPEDNDTDILDTLPPDFALVASHPSDPTSLNKALRGPNAKEWEEALQYKINQLEKFETWDVEDLPVGQTAIPCSEVLRVKRGPDGVVQSYRLRIVAGRHKQIQGIDYTETFSATAKMPTVCVVLANAAHQDWEIEHIDVG